MPREEAEEVPLEEAPMSRHGAMVERLKTDRVPYMCLNSICRRQARRAHYMSDQSWQRDRESAALRVVKERSQVSALAWLLCMTQEFRDKMPDEQMMQLYTALRSGKGMVRQWIEERGLTPPQKGN